MRHQPSHRHGVPAFQQTLRELRARSLHRRLFNLDPDPRPPMRKYYRDHVRHDRTDYTVFPLGWRGVNRMGGRGEIVACPKCGRRGLTMPGYRQQGRYHGEWMSTMILHFYPPHMVGEMMCCLFDSEDAPYAA